MLNDFDDNEFPLAYFISLRTYGTWLHGDVRGSDVKPEPILLAFQAYATRKLRSENLLAQGVKPWTRHGSTIYLWKERNVELAIDYVLYGQGDDLPSFED